MRAISSFPEPAHSKDDLQALSVTVGSALRHWYASVLLDAGESIRAVSEYLGHSDPGFTLRTYTHLMPDSSERTRGAVDAAFAAARESTSRAR